MENEGQGPATPGTAARCETPDEAYRRGWSEGASARDPETDAVLRAMKERHTARWWTATPAERVADMAEYAQAKAEEWHWTEAARSVVETMRAAAEALAASAAQPPSDSVPEIERLRAENASLREQMDDCAPELRAKLAAAREVNTRLDAQWADTEKRNASLLESLRAAKKQEAELIDELMELNETASAAEQRAEAAKKQNTERQGALRAALGTMQGPMAEMEKRCVLDRPHDHGHLCALRAAMQILQDAHDAALHDEERSAPQEGEDGK